MAIKRKAYVNRGECVACGCCVRVCPMGAMTQLVCKAKSKTSSSEKSK